MDTPSSAVTTFSTSRTVIFRVPVAARVVHEDTDTDIATVECLVEEALDGGGIRVEGFHSHTLNPPGPADPHTERRLRVVAADARVAVTAPDGTAPGHLTHSASSQLAARLKALRRYGIRLVDEPAVWQDSDTARDEQDLLDLDHPDHDVPGDNVLDDDVAEHDALAHCVEFLDGPHHGANDDQRGGEEPGYDRESDPADHPHRRSRPHPTPPRP